MSPNSEIDPWQPAQPTLDRPKVGVGVFPFHDGKLLLGKRRNTHGSSEWSTPGGHLEHAEGLLACAARELMEETGLSAKKWRFAGVANNLLGAEKKHYVTLCVIAEELTGTLELREPEKCEGWEWFHLDALPKPLFASVETFLWMQHESPALFHSNIAYGHSSL